ncbi:MAG TPA: C45 family peptidase [Polyangiaceae bacterium]|nr:C45 family peptidase [Polyangiaceae bacterium]
MTRRFWFRLAGVATLLVLLLMCGHFAVRRVGRMPAPNIELTRSQPTRDASGVRRLGKAFALDQHGVLEVHLEGSPREIGWAHARLLYPEMVENEGVLLTNFEKAVPSWPLRLLLLDLAQLRYRDLSRGLTPERRNEIAAGALGFQPDPYSGVFPTYQRFVYLNALYDIALSFEHSPLIGCTSFVFSGARAEHGGSLFGRNFDFEVDPIFDRKKAVFFVRETGKVPFASVAWPGLVGVVSGMNLEGVALVVHGGRAGTPLAEGDPVVHTMRAVLSHARTSEEALSVLAQHPPLVSHIVVLTDAYGRGFRVERVPGARDFAAPLGDAAAVTNHLEGPSRLDPKNQSVREHTSTVPRKARADELVALAPPVVDSAFVVGALRDRKAYGGRPLAPGDRNAIDAHIATHAVVMDTAKRVLWVSTGPHLAGRFVAFDLTRRLGEGYLPEPNADLPQIPADPSLLAPNDALFDKRAQ